MEGGIWYASLQTLNSISTLTSSFLLVLCYLKWYGGTLRDSGTALKISCIVSVLLALSTGAAIQVWNDVMAGKITLALT